MTLLTSRKGNPWRVGIAAAAAFMGLALPHVQDANETIAFLEPLIGEWTVAFPDSVLRQNPQLRDLVTHRYAWTVGRMAIRISENLPGGRVDDAEVDGLIYWDPATERVEFVAVAGRDSGQGRLFRGEYTLLADGGIQRVYDVYYRNAADMPGEEFGGSRRRYREVFYVGGDTPGRHTLDWWWKNRWQAYGRGEYQMKRFTR